MADNDQKGKLFEYAVLYHPKATKDQIERADYPKSEVVTELKSVLAKNEQEVAMLAARSIPSDYADKLDSVEILVRPFA